MDPTTVGRAWHGDWRQKWGRTRECAEEAAERGVGIDAEPEPMGMRLGTSPATKLALLASRPMTMYGSRMNTGWFHRASRTEMCTATYATRRQVFSRKLSYWCFLFIYLSILVPAVFNHSHNTLYPVSHATHSASFAWLHRRA